MTNTQAQESSIKMTPEQLMSVYPTLDYLMAETILKCYENGTLALCMDAPLIEPAEVVLTPITIENPTDVP
jgi:hypothetical protein